MSLRIRTLHTLDECRVIRADWARLVQLEGSGVLAFDVSATFEWAEALWQSYANGVPRCVLVAEDDSGVRGILPCFVSGETLGRISHRKLTPTAAIYDLRTGFLVGGDADVLERLLGHAFEKVDGWSTFMFRVVDSSPSDLAIREVMRRRGTQMFEMRQWRSPYIPLPSDPTLVLASLRPKLRYNIKRGEKQLQTLGKLQMKVFDTEDCVPAFLDIMEVVEERSWKLDAGTAMNTSEQQKKLYSVVTSALARQKYFLGAVFFLDERPLAFIYGYSFGGVFVDEKESYDEQYKDYGPGNVLKTKFLAELVRRGVGTHDYAGREDAHKARWTDQSYSRRVYVVYNTTVRARMIKMSLWAQRMWQALRRFRFGA